MRNIFIKTIIFSAIALPMFFIGRDISYAQNPNCNVIDADFRYNPNVVPNPNGDDDGDGRSNFVEEFFIDDQRPYVYLDIKTTGCLDSNDVPDIEISVSEQNLGFDESGGVGGVGGMISQLHQWPIDVPSDNFSIAYKAGETLCDYYSFSFSNCEYLIETSTNGALFAQEWPGLLEYDCDTSFAACDESWTYLGFLTYGQSHADDQNTVTPPSTTTNQPDGLNEAYLAPLPGLENATSGLQGFLQGLFNVAIVVAGILAILMIVIGAITYLSTDSLAGTEKGRDMMLNAVLGLILALGAWVILNTLNPNLAESLRITIPKANFTNYEFSEPGIVSEYTPPTNQELNCPNCVDVDSSIQASNNRGVRPSFLIKIINLNNNLMNAGITWRITEAFPPTGNHKNSCHYNGTCIDANFFPQINPTPQQVNDFIQAAKDAGLSAVYETNTTAKYQQLINSGLPNLIPYPGNLSSGVLMWTQITAPHFSIYQK